MKKAKEPMRVRIGRWIIKVLLWEYHLSLNPPKGRKNVCKVRTPTSEELK